MAPADAASVEAARLRLFALPLSDRVRISCAMFRQVEPASRQLRELSSEPDGFALQAPAKQALMAHLVEAHPLFCEVIAAMTPAQLLQASCGWRAHLRAGGVHMHGPARRPAWLPAWQHACALGVEHPLALIRRCRCLLTAP